MLPMRDGRRRQTREDRATQPMDCWRLILAILKINIKQAHKLQDAQAEKPTSLQAHRLINWKAATPARWQDEKMTGWQVDKMAKVSKSCQTLPNVGGKFAKCGKSWLMFAYVSKCWQMLPKYCKSFQLLTKVGKQWQTSAIIGKHGHRKTSENIGKHQQKWQKLAKSWQNLAKAGKNWQVDMKCWHVDMMAWWHGDKLTRIHNNNSFTF